MTIVFLDANVLAKPVTRTILMVGGMPSGFRAVWSLAAEREAAAHMRPRAIPPTLVRERLGLLLAPSGDRPERFAGTKGADRQILADAAAAGARFLVTEDVDDYALNDLASVGISAVNPDLFLAGRLTRDAYATVIDLFVERQLNPPTTPAGFHAAIARQHPGLFVAHADLYDSERAKGVHAEPAVIFRGTRCHHPTVRWSDRPCRRRPDQDPARVEAGRDDRHTARTTHPGPPATDEPRRVSRPRPV